MAALRCNHCQLPMTQSEAENGACPVCGNELDIKHDFENPLRIVFHGSAFLLYGLLAAVGASLIWLTNESAVWWGIFWIIVGVILGYVGLKRLTALGCPHCRATVYYPKNNCCPTCRNELYETDEVDELLDGTSSIAGIGAGLVIACAKWFGIGPKTTRQPSKFQKSFRKVKLLFHGVFFLLFAVMLVALGVLFIWHGRGRDVGIGFCLFAAGLFSAYLGIFEFLKQV